jgi:hypothetical protein
MKLPFCVACSLSPGRPSTRQRRTSYPLPLIRKAKTMITTERAASGGAKDVRFGLCGCSRAKNWIGKTTIYA